MQVEAADLLTSRDFADFSLRAFVRASTYGMYQRVNQKSGPSSSFMKEQTATMMGSNVATLGMRLGSMSRRINGDGHRRRLATSTISATSALSHNKRHPLVVNKPENALEIQIICDSKKAASKEAVALAVIHIILFNMYINLYWLCCQSQFSSPKAFLQQSHQPLQIIHVDVVARVRERMHRQEWIVAR